MPTRPTSSTAAKTLRDAASESPVLVKLGALIAQSSQFLKDIQHLIPQGLRSAVKAGPLDDESWCVVVSSPTVASKLRHLLPDIEQHLRNTHCSQVTVRIKVAKA